MRKFTGGLITSATRELASGKRWIYCRSCRIAHITNCGTCLGFGVRARVWQNPDGTITVIDGAPCVPITMSEAHDWSLMPERGSSPCPECASTPVGPTRHPSDQ